MATASRLPEVWAGLECTVNRVGDQFFDQIARTGHDTRPDDLGRLAALGIKALRYPILWERHPGPGESIDWSWTDDRLRRLRNLGVTPIIGLVHHGSGPSGTSLIDPEFPEGLAAFAGRVAERYPWIEAYTPVNEPLTTARFSGLYGHWYPHARDTRMFLRALLTQCRAVVRAMQEIRRVNPAARLVQTEDLGQTHSAPSLAYQTAFENERRWLTWDLLCGRVGRDHPLADFLRWAGASDAEIAWFAAHPFPPAILGVNYYVTSERYLDDRTDRYPEAMRGGNGRESYVDAEAVRLLPEGPVGLADLLCQAWARYRLPLAVTEAHLGCTREEQLRWLLGVWQAACRARKRGADVRAVTAWSAFGAYDWDSLVTRAAGHDEPGLYDARTNPPRPTAAADLVRTLASGQAPTHPVLATPGWWQRPERLLFPAPALVAAPPANDARRIAIAGGTGTLGRAFARICQGRGLAFVSLTRAEMDIADLHSVAAALERHKPWAVINAAGYVRVDEAEREARLCWRENARGPAVLAAACRAAGVKLLTFSSDLVFDGRARRPYREDDPVAPLSVYGATKAAAEGSVLARNPDALVVRTSAFFGPWDRHNFVCQTLQVLRAGLPFCAAEDVVVSPTYVPDLCHAALDLLIDGVDGVWHLATPDPLTWAEFARVVAERSGHDPDGVIGRPAASFGWAATRPEFSALGCTRGCALPPLASGLDHFLREYDLKPAA